MTCWLAVHRDHTHTWQVLHDMQAPRRSSTSQGPGAGACAASGLGVGRPSPAETAAGPVSRGGFAPGTSALPLSSAVGCPGPRGRPCCFSSSSVSARPPQLALGPWQGQRRVSVPRPTRGELERGADGDRRVGGPTRTSAGSPGPPITEKAVSSTTVRAFQKWLFVPELFSYL